jgi:hypothetical protein
MQHHLELHPFMDVLIIREVLVLVLVKRNRRRALWGITYTHEQTPWKGAYLFACHAATLYTHRNPPPNKPWRTAQHRPEAGYVTEQPLEWEWDGGEIHAVREWICGGGVCQPKYRQQHETAKTGANERLQEKSN